MNNLIFVTPTKEHESQVMELNVLAGLRLLHILVFVFPMAD